MPPASPSPEDSLASPRHPTFREALRFWLKLGFISFGGPTGQIAIMHTELVERRRWISDARFLHALNYCMLLPGPEAQQLSIYVGWLLHRTVGGLAAGILFVLPSVFILWTLSFIYAAYGNVEWIAAIFHGLQPAVLAIVAAAVVRLGSKALKNGAMWAIAGLAFIGIVFAHLPFPLIILSAGLLGLLDGVLWPRRLIPAASPHGSPSGAGAALHDESAVPEHARPSLARAVKILAVGLALWWTPMALAGLLLGVNHAIFREGLFFSKAALVTFGGAYAVLPYVAQQAVETYGWLQPGQMLDGLGLAETTPGPLIMVLQFVGFMGGWNQPGSLSPLAAATLGALLTTWVTFVPCFLLIFLGAPHVEQLRGNARLNATLSAITAAVVGVVLNLAVWFAQHVLFPGNAVDWFAVGVSTVALVGLVRFKWGVIAVVLGASLLGLLSGWLR